MSNAVKYKKSNHLHTVEHVVQSTFQNLFFEGGGGGGGRRGGAQVRAPSFAPSFIKIFWHNHIIIF